jgi:hypothetical protein
MYRRASQGASPKGRETRRRVDREMQTTLIQATSEMARQPSDGWYDMRRGRERWWGNLCRRIDELHSLNAPKDRVKMIARVLDAYIEEVYADDHTNRAA